MQVRFGVVLALSGLASCSSEPVDCYKVSPSDCAKYTQCRTVSVWGLDNQCVQLSKPVACKPVDAPGCQMGFYLRDPTGQCWGMGECVVPQGWQYDDGACYSSGLAIYNACFPQDAGTATDSQGTDTAGQ
jgi:hypothetical protein